VQEIRDILQVLIVAAEHYSLQHDGGEYTRLLTFCKRICKFFNKCSDSGGFRTVLVILLYCMCGLCSLKTNDAH
jgi:hypothetical protein